MVKRRITRKKKTTQAAASIQRDTRFVSASLATHKDINDVMQDQQFRLYHHPYATRSKTLRTAKSSMNVDENNYTKLKRRKSDSSIEFLGTYRKVPQLVVLEETSEGRCIEFVEKPEALICLKAEKVI